MKKTARQVYSPTICMLELFSCCSFYRAKARHEILYRPLESAECCNINYDKSHTHGHYGGLLLKSCYKNH